MSRLPGKKDEQERDPVDESLQTLKVQTVDKSNKARVKQLCQDCETMPTNQEMGRAHSRNPYCRKIWGMVSNYPKWLFNENDLLSTMSTKHDSIYIILSQKYQGAVLHRTQYLKQAGHSSAWRT